MSIRKFIAVALLILPCLFGAPDARAQEPEKRDLSRYEKGDEFFLRYWYGSMLDDEAAATARVRDFLWERWRGKKMAYCSIRIGYNHGDSLKTDYYVEPDQEGRWRIVVERVSSCCGLEVLEAAMAGQQKEMKIETRIVGSFYTVSRVDAESGSPLSEQGRRKPETYRLLLQDGRPRAKDEIGLSNPIKL